MRHRFTIKLELDNIDRSIKSQIAKAKEDLYDSGECYLTSAGAQSLLKCLPREMSKECLKVVRGYATILSSRDVTTIHEYLDKKQKEIIKLTHYKKLEPSNLSFIEGHKEVSVDDDYYNNYKDLTLDFKAKMEIVKQRVSNEYLRDRRRRSEIIIPVIVSSVLSIIAIIVSALSLGAKHA